MAAQALRLTMLTGARTAEVLGMRWEEIDWQDKVWTCPEERMKNGEAHRVPLTDAMISIIEPF